MLWAIADVERPIVAIKIKSVERSICDDPVRDLERPPVRNVEVDALTKARTKRLAIPIQLATGMLVPAQGYVLNQLAQRADAKPYVSSIDPK